MSIDPRIWTYYQKYVPFAEKEKDYFNSQLGCSPELHDYIFKLFKEVTTTERIGVEEMFDALCVNHKKSLYCLLLAALRLQRKLRNSFDCASEIKRVIFHDPATIVFWRDGSKTVVKAENEPYDPEKGLAMAIAKHTLGNEGNYYNQFRKWLPKKGEENT